MTTYYKIAERTLAVSGTKSEYVENLPGFKIFKTDKSDDAFKIVVNDKLYDFSGSTPSYKLINEGVEYLFYKLEDIGYGFSLI